MNQLLFQNNCHDFLIDEQFTESDSKLPISTKMASIFLINTGTFRLAPS